MKASMIALSFVFLFASFSSGQEKTPEPKALNEEKGKAYKNSLDFCPEYPFVDVYAVQYSRELTIKDELMLGIAYLNQKYDCGHSNAGGVIVGYRRYVWQNFHVEYQIWPIYDNFYEKNEGKYYKSFDVWNEFRIGYRFDFMIFESPFYFNVQWPFGFGLYGSNKPESFKKENSGLKRFFYFPPLVFIGKKF